MSGLEYMNVKQRRTKEVVKDFKPARHTSLPMAANCDDNDDNDDDGDDNDGDDDDDDSNDDDDDNPRPALIALHVHLYPAGWNTQLTIFTARISQAWQHTNKVH